LWDELRRASYQSAKILQHGMQEESPQRDEITANRGRSCGDVLSDLQWADHRRRSARHSLLLAPLFERSTPTA
jgi:hypothetical protein